MDTPASISIGQKIRLRMRRTTYHGQRIDWSAYVFLLPFFILFMTFTIVAIIFGAYIAFNDWGIMGAPQWVGLANFKTAFSDEWVVKAFTNILKYGLIIVPGVTILGLIFAVYVNKRWFLSDIVRAAFYSPNVVSATVIGLVWVWILDTQVGLVNKYLNLIGISNIPWLTSTQWSLIGVSIASIWWDLGFSFVLFLAALQEIPGELQEAAEIDGASGMQSFWYVSLPILRPTISMIVTLQLIATMRIFSQVYMMTNGGPAGSSVSVIHYIYTTAIIQLKLGYAAAVSLMLFVVILVVTFIQQRLIRESD
jgi:multiple sugar transport system permease protein